MFSVTGEKSKDLHWSDDSIDSCSSDSSNKRKFGPKIGSTVSMKKRNCRTEHLRDGKSVEVRSDEEGYVGAWYEAIIVREKGENKYLVEYKTLVTDDESALLREVADGKDIRPCPSQMKVLFYPRFQKVDVWYNEGWWEGVISQVLGGSMYAVYFSSTDEEMEFDDSVLRLHQDWINQQWTIPFKVWIDNDRHRVQL